MSDNVISALSAVMDELGPIGKDQTASAQQGGYAYRGIEQITRNAQPLFAKHGIVFVPRVTGWELREITVNGKPWTDTLTTVEYDVYGPGGIEDKITVGPILAIGRDNSDKGANKCMTQAYKYALLQTLCISDAKDDGDQASHEADANEPTIPASLVERLKALPEAVQTDALGRAAKRSGLPITSTATFAALPASWEAYVTGLLDHLESNGEAQQPTLTGDAA